MHDENPYFFWKFVDKIISFEMEQSHSVEQRYRGILKAARIVFGNDLDELKIRLLKFALSTRNYSPAIEMNQQVSKIISINEFLQSSSL